MTSHAVLSPEEWIFIPSFSSSGPPVGGHSRQGRAGSGGRVEKLIAFDPSLREALWERGRREMGMSLC